MKIFSNPSLFGFSTRRAVSPIFHAPPRLALHIISIIFNLLMLKKVVLVGGKYGTP